jgi:rhamnogalacturonyl hydrolase YesR
MLEAMPSHSEMSDAMFLGTPLLAVTARLTRDPKYREMALRHLRFMVKMNRRPDALHQHSPLDPEHTAWGRGNGFVTLGLVLTLSELSEGSPGYVEVLELFREHLTAMISHQDVLGMWHQVIDHPESYREFTVTCMTTFAIVRGIRCGWLERERFDPLVRSAWRSIKQRIASDGSLADVCAGTGKMKSLREYLDRPAILGKDDRGGAMALLVSTELAYAEREKQLSLN